MLHYVVEVLKVLPDEVADAAVLQDGLEGAIRGLVSHCGTTNGDIINVGDHVLGNLWLKNVCHIVVEDGNCVSPTHQDFGKTKGVIWHLESGVVMRCFSKCTFIVSDIQVKNSSGGMTFKLLSNLFGERSDTGMLVVTALRGLRL